MVKAFIFDVDGVIIDTEPMWDKVKTEIYVSLFGKDIFHKLGSTIGLSMDVISEKASELGSSITSEELRNAFFKHSNLIYNTAPLTPGIDLLGKTLIDFGYSIGAVSASPKEWIDIAINRLSFKNDFKLVLSLDKRSDLPHKPAPDGYLEAIRMLGSTPQSTIILEDSNAGIASAKAAGAFVIGLRENLVEGQSQNGADIYADNINEVISIIKNK